MQLRCSKENLAKGVQAVRGAVASHGVLPVLSNILVEALPGGVTLTATDLELGIKTDVPAEVKEEGTVTLPAKTLGEIIARLPEADVEFASTNGGAETQITCDKVTFTLRGLPPGEFPALPQAEGKVAVSFDASTLQRAIKLTTFATANDDTKSTLSGVFVQIEGKRLELAATDGYRLACFSYDLAKSIKTGLQIIVPTRSLQELARLAGASGPEAKVNLTLCNNQSVWEVEGKILTSRLIDGQYPRYRDIIPQAFEKKALIERELLLAAVERAAIMASERTNNIIHLEIKPGELHLTAGTPDMGNAAETLSVEYAGEPLAIAFNAKYLIEAIRHQEAVALQLELGTSLSPALLHGAKDGAYLCLIMPVRAK